jgi:hypothetical protein
MIQAIPSRGFDRKFHIDSRMPKKKPLGIKTERLGFSKLIVVTASWEQAIE